MSYLLFDCGVTSSLSYGLPRPYLKAKTGSVNVSRCNRPNEPAEKQEDILEKPSKDGSVLSKEEKEAEQKARNEANMAANQENVKKALARLTKEGVAKGKQYFDAAWKQFQEAMDQMPEEQKNKPLKPVPVRTLYPSVHQSVSSNKSFRAFNGPLLCNKSSHP